MDLNPEALLVGRESRGLTQQALSEKAGITQGRISKAEHGLTGMRPEEVEAISKVLRYPTEFFYEPGRIRVAGTPCLFHRKRKTLPAKTLRRLDAVMAVRLINARRLMGDVVFDPSRIFHRFDPDEHGGPSATAQALRRAWRMPAGPIRNVTALMESAAGMIFLEDFGTTKLMGMSSWERNVYPIFLLNSRMSTADLRWTIAHELGHLTMHHFPTEGDDPEAEADEFAGEFLAPEHEIRPTLRGLEYRQLPALKSYWGLSMKGVITRASKLGAISKAQATKLYKQHSARGHTRVEPYELPHEPPTLAASAIQLHLSEHGYSVPELAFAVRLDPEELSILTGRTLPEGNQDPSNVVSLFPQRD